jgi:hypothetical protein
MFTGVEELWLNSFNAQVVVWMLAGQIWKFIPVPGSGPPPSYDGDVTGEPSTRTQQHAESERDDFGTIVTEVTIVTTRKKYRVEDV